MKTMTKISINLLRWSTPWEEIQRCIAAVLNSEFKDFGLTYTENPHVSALSLMDEVKRQFGHDVRIRAIRNEHNAGYAGAHNQFFAATGKMLKPEVLNGDQNEKILDGTGIEIYGSRRARERGQLERDHGQYDRDRTVFGVSGTAAAYRKSALERVRLGE